jgi:hypothetical protein
MLVKRIAAVVAVALMVLTSPAWAASRPDPDDADGRLDIKRITVNAEPQELGTMIIRTYGPWNSTFLRPALDNPLVWKFNDGDDRDFDLLGTFRYTDGALRLFLTGVDTGNTYGPFLASRPDRRSVRVRFSFDIPELQSNHLSVVVRSESSGRECPDDPCKDRAPNFGNMNAF